MSEKWKPYIFADSIDNINFTWRIFARSLAACKATWMQSSIYVYVCTPNIFTNSTRASFIISYESFWTRTRSTQFYFSVLRDSADIYKLRAVCENVKNSIRRDDWFKRRDKYRSCWWQLLCSPRINGLWRFFNRPGPLGLAKHSFIRARTQFQKITDRAISFSRPKSHGGRQTRCSFRYFTQDTPPYHRDSVKQRERRERTRFIDNRIYKQPALCSIT